MACRTFFRPGLRDLRRRTRAISGSTPTNGLSSSKGEGAGPISRSIQGITDRAEPCESLKATTVFCLGL